MAVGVGLFGLCLALLLNRSTVRVGHGDMTHWYTLHARLRSGRSVKVMPNCPLEVIRAVEHLVEKRLGLVDAPVAGEHQG